MKKVFVSLLLALLVTLFISSFAMATQAVDWDALVESGNAAETTLQVQAAETASGIEWGQVFSTILYSLLSTAVPILTVQLYRYLAAKRKQIWGDMYDTDIQRGVDDAIDAVYTAVAQTNQTYVDSLKDQNLFSLENHKIAFDKSMSTAKTLFTEAAEHAITTLYGSVENWLTAKIEQATRELKPKGDGMLEVAFDTDAQTAEEVKGAPAGTEDGGATDPFASTDEPVQLE